MDSETAGIDIGKHLPKGLTAIGVFKDAIREFKGHFRRKVDAVRELAENARGVDSQYNATKFDVQIEEHDLGWFLITTCDGVGIDPDKVKRILNLGHDEQDIPSEHSLYSRQGKGLKAATYALGTVTYIWSKHTTGWSISVIGEALPGKMLSYSSVTIQPELFNGHANGFNQEDYLSSIKPLESSNFRECMELMVRKKSDSVDAYGVNKYSPFKTVEKLVQQFGKIPADTGVRTMTLLHKDTSLQRTAVKSSDDASEECEELYDIVDTNVSDNAGRPSRLSQCMARWWLPVDQEIHPQHGRRMQIKCQDFTVDPALHPWSKARRAKLSRSRVLSTSLEHEGVQHKVSMQLTLVSEAFTDGFHERVNDESCGFIVHQKDRALHYEGIAYFGLIVYNMAGSPIFPHKGLQSNLVTTAKGRNQGKTNRDVYRRLAAILGLSGTTGETSEGRKGKGKKAGPLIEIPGVPWQEFQAVPPEGKARKYMAAGCGVLGLIVVDNSFVDVVGLGDNKQSFNDHPLAKAMYDWAYQQVAAWAWALPHPSLPLAPSLELGCATPPRPTAIKRTVPEHSPMSEAAEGTADEANRKRSRKPPKVLVLPDFRKEKPATPHKERKPKEAAALWPGTNGIRKARSFKDVRKSLQALRKFVEDREAVCDGKPESASAQHLQTPLLWHNACKEALRHLTVVAGF